jgi:hypothetical protein
MEHNEDYQLEDILTVLFIWACVIVMIYNDIKESL